MTKVIKLHKGLTISLKGAAEERKMKLGRVEQFALMPDDFVGLTPKVVVREGVHVQAGEPLFVNKRCPDVGFASPVSGVVTAVVRGDRRKVLRVVVDADEEQSYVDFGKRDVASLSGDDVKQTLLKAGLFGFMNQLPYAVTATPDVEPKAIFVSALRDMPLACDFSFELKGNETAWQAGLTALSKMAPVYVGIGKQQKAKALTDAKDVTVTVFDGECPAGNVGVQVNHLAPVNKGEVVFTVDPTVVIFIGRLFTEGKVDLTRTIAIAGSQVTSPEYIDAKVGTPLRSLLEGNLVRTDHIRIINGNPLTGTVSSMDDFLGAHTSEVTVIPEGDSADEFLGWILPRPKQFSASRSYMGWLLGKRRKYDLDARIKGGERHMIMSGEYDKVFPMDIYPEYLIKAILAKDIDKMEQLGIYEVAPEDFALAEFVDSSKLPLQRIVREGLTMLQKENA